jgi:hypothetical protein
LKISPYKVLAPFFWDSLFGMDNLRSSYLIGVKPPYEPSINELKDLKTGTDCDYLIN